MPEGYSGLPPYYVLTSSPITPNLGLSLKGMDPIVAENFVLVDTAVGGGSSSVQINGVAVANPNFNDLLPAPPLGFTNVLWQVVGSSVSGYVPMGGGGNLAGDVTGPVASNTVIKIQGTPVSSSAPTDNQVLTYISADGQWEPQEPSIIGNAVLYLDNTVMVGSYKSLVNTLPSAIPEQTASATGSSTDGEVLIAGFLSDSGSPGLNLLGMGIWTMHSYAACSSLSGGTNLVARIYKYATDTTETELWSNTIALTSTLTTEYLKTFNEEAFGLDPTDRLLIKYFLLAGDTNSRTLTLYFDDVANASHFHFPASFINRADESLSGDVAGPLDMTVIEEIQGYTVLASGTNAPTAGDFLQFDGVNWTPNNIGLASILYFSTDQSFADFPGISLVLSQVGVVGTTVTYTGTITNGASNWYLGKKFQIAGFTNPNNNGLITVTASTATTLVCTHASQANETDPATATEVYHGWDTVVDPNPEATTVLAATSAMGNVVLESFGTISGYPNVTSIPAGEWIADLYIQTNTAAGTQTGYVQILARHLDGTETALFDTSGTPFVFNGNGTTVNHYTVEVVETAFTILTTDTLVCKVWINVSANRTVTLYYGGTTHYSHIHTPIGSVTAPVTSVFGRFGNVVATAGDYPWNFNGNATADLVLANAGFNTTFNQTSATNWKWANTTAATVTVPQPSPILALSGQYWATGAVTGEDKWTIQPVLTAGLNGASTLTIAHTGSTGAARVNLPLLSLGGIDAGISRLGAASLAIGNGTAGDFSGSLKLASLNVVSTSSTYGASQVTITNSVATGRAYYSAINDLGNSFGMSIDGSTGAALANQAFFFSTDVGTPVALMAFSTNAQNASGGSTPIAFLAGGYGVTPQLKILATGAIQIGGSDLGISRLGAASLAIGNGTAGDTTGNLSFNTVIKYGGSTTVSQGIPSEIIAIDLTAQSAAIGATNIIASAPRSGMYRISWSADITTAATTSSVLGGTNGFQVGYTSPTDSVAKTTVPGNSVTSAGNTTGTAVGGSIVVYAKTATAITYAYDYTSVGVTGMQFELHVRLEAM